MVWYLSPELQGGGVRFSGVVHVGEGRDKFGETHPIPFGKGPRQTGRPSHTRCALPVAVYIEFYRQRTLRVLEAKNIPRLLHLERRL